MYSFITIATFQFPHEAQIFKSKLESEGIAVFLKDELTVQMHSYINAIGGIKLQVREPDVASAMDILQEAGVTGVVAEQEEPAYIRWIDRRTNEIPVLKKLPVVMRGFILLAVILTAVVVGVLLALITGTVSK